MTHKRNILLGVRVLASKKDAEIAKGAGKLLLRRWSAYVSLRSLANICWIAERSMQVWPRRLRTCPF